MRSLSRIVTVLALFALLGGAALLLLKDKQPPATVARNEEKVPVTAIRVVPGVFRDTGEYAARLEARRDVTIVAEAAGRIVEDGVSEGERVAAGQVLFRLENDSQRHAVSRAEAALELARQNLLKAEDASRPELIRRLEAMAEESEAALAKAESDAGRFERLYQEGAVSLGQKENVDLALAAARARARVARENLEEARRGARKEDRAAAEAAVRQAEAGLALAREALEKTAVASPLQGIVASKKVFAGDTLRAGQPVAEVVDISAFKITVGVSAADVEHFRRGERVDVAVRPAGSVRSATVMDVGVKAGDRTGSFPVILELPSDGEGTPGIRAGMDVMVRFVRAREEGVLVVPRRSFIEERDGYRAFVAVNGRAQEVRVRIGRMTESDAVVTDGLAAGDVLIVVGQQRLKNGDLLELFVEE